MAETLSGKIGLPVKVGNDANVAALGEMWKGGGQGCKNGMYGSIIGGVHERNRHMKVCLVGKCNFALE